MKMTDVYRAKRQSLSWGFVPAVVVMCGEDAVSLVSDLLRGRVAFKPICLVRVYEMEVRLDASLSAGRFYLLEDESVLDRAGKFPVED